MWKLFYFALFGLHFVLQYDYYPLQSECRDDMCNATCANVITYMRFDRHQGYTNDIDHYELIIKYTFNNTSVFVKHYSYDGVYKNCTTKCYYCLNNLEGTLSPTHSDYYIVRMLRITSFVIIFSIMIFVSLLSSGNDEG